MRKSTRVNVCCKNGKHHWLFPNACHFFSHCSVVTRPNYNAQTVSVATRSDGILTNLICWIKQIAKHRRILEKGKSLSGSKCSFCVTMRINEILFSVFWFSFLLSDVTHAPPNLSNSVDWSTMILVRFLFSDKFSQLFQKKIENPFENLLCNLIWVERIYLNVSVCARTFNSAFIFHLLSSYSTVFLNVLPYVLSMSHNTIDTKTLEHFRPKYDTKFNFNSNTLLEMRHKMRSHFAI